jgi:hypothetical protein
MTGRRPWLAAVLALAVGSGCSRDATDKLSFNRDIRPILSANCYGCHGPDSSSRKAGMRLDQSEFAYAAHGEFGPAIVPGKPDRSPLVRRIEATDPKERMPPPEAHKTLTGEQVALLRRWIAEGAKYEPHWAFISPQRSVVPGAGEGWARNPIDRFIAERLKREALQPSPEATRSALIRRVSLDLTGLPPSPEDVAAFLADGAPDAYERLVDRLLASRHYGEHRAHYWLDYVRYADTHGLHIDNYRAIWPYRDYVIRAFNANLSFDGFVRQQLAGDLIPASTLDELIATGFVRANLTTNEGGTVPEEVFVNQTRDRVETFGIVFLGLTAGCAACHDHKFDPTSQKDFYQLAAFLGNTAEVHWDFNSAAPEPVVRLPDPDAEAAAAAVLKERAALERQLRARREAAPEALRARIAAGTRPRAVTSKGLELHLRFDEGAGDRLRNSAPHATQREFKVDVNPLVWGETSWLWPSARFDMNSRLSLGSVGDVEADDAFSGGSWIMLRARPGSNDVRSGSLIARFGGLGASDSRGWEIRYRDRRFIVSLFGDATARHSPPRKTTKEDDESLPPFEPARRAIQVATRDDIEPGRWLHVFFTYDGSRRTAGVSLYVNGARVPVEVKNDTLGPTDSIRTRHSTFVGSHASGDPLRETRYQDLRFYRRALAPEEVARLPFEDPAAAVVARQPEPAKWNADESFIVIDRYFLGTADEEAVRIAGEIGKLDTRFAALTTDPARPRPIPPAGKKAPEPPPVEVLRKLLADRPASLIAMERPAPAYAHVLKRGDYASRGERVGPGTPHFLPALGAGEPRNRLGLANWLFTPEQPLFARVAVNRMWQEIFGRGLVESSGDFGVTGDTPSHPELLDWLAVEFRESGWDVKRFYRLMVTSATYRQASMVSATLREKDPGNRLLARGPRFRMDIEMLRDSALFVSGLLVDKAGGPPVKPYQPPGLWGEVAMPESNTREYEQDTGEALYRRSLYTFLKRSSPPPGMETFDAPSRETVCARRARSNTPLQALVTLNDPQWVEAARELAARTMAAASSADAGDGADRRLDYLASLTLSRELAPAERATIAAALQTYRLRFRERPDDARALLGVGEKPADAAVDPVELAAWTLVASMYLNLDEFLTK